MSKNDLKYVDVKYMINKRIKLYKASNEALGISSFKEQIKSFEYVGNVAAQVSLYEALGDIEYILDNGEGDE